MARIRSSLKSGLALILPVTSVLARELQAFVTHRLCKVEKTRRIWC